MKTYKLKRDVFSETVDLTGKAVYEGWLPAQTVVQPCTENDSSPWTGRPRCNHADGIPVRIIRTAEGSSGSGLAHEILLGVKRLADVADLVD